MKITANRMLAICCFLIFIASICSAHGASESNLSITTAAPHILVVSFTDDFGLRKFPTDPLNTNISDWKINGVCPLYVYHRSSSIDELPKTENGEYPILRKYWTYLVLENSLVSGKNYIIEGPFGKEDMIFDPLTIDCESLKVNQVSYLPSSSIRYANLGVYMGSGGSYLFPNLPNYQVLDINNGASLFSGVAEYRGDDTEVSSKTVSSGEYVYRLDLSTVPQGGPYVVLLEGAGISPPFYISNEKVGFIASTYSRFLYHQRCGIALEEPYTDYVRDACHTEVALTRTPWSSNGGIVVKSSDALIPMQGGYHDAGDFDRRPYHTIIPILLLGYYEAFPSHFLDGQYNIVDSGNGLPDFLDEALWGVLLWENLQILDPQDNQYGAIMAGTETSAHPEYGKVNAASDSLVYGTWEATAEVTALGSGMMAQASRLLLNFPGYEEMARELYRRSQLAYEALKEFQGDEGEAYLKQASGAMLYSSLQNALALESFEPDNKSKKKILQRQFSQLADTLLIHDGYWPEQYRPGNITARIQTVYFSSFLLMESCFDEQLQQNLKELVFKQAEMGGYMGFDSSFPFYAQGATKAYGWGAATAQGRYGDVIAFAYRLEKESEKRSQYLNILSQFADYALGLNPLGQSYVTGLGSAQVRSPLHLDSWFTRFKEELGPVPGLLVYGPSAERSQAGYQRVISDTLFPLWDELPLQRRWADGWSLVNNNEFSVWETSVWNMCLYGVLYDPTL